METSAAVCVIMPVHNGASYLEEALNSLKHQGLNTLDVLCVLYASTDDSELLLKHHAATMPHLRVLHAPASLPTNKEVAAVQWALTHCNSPYCFYLPQHNTLAPQTLAYLHQQALSHHADAVLPELEYWYKYGKVFKEGPEGLWPSATHPVPPLLQGPEAFALAVAGRLHPFALWKTEVLQALPPAHWQAPHWEPVAYGALAHTQQVAVGLPGQGLVRWRQRQGLAYNPPPPLTQQLQGLQAQCNLLALMAQPHLRGAFSKATCKAQVRHATGVLGALQRANLGEKGGLDAAALNGTTRTLTALAWQLLGPLACLKVWQRTTLALWLQHKPKLWLKRLFEKNTTPVATPQQGLTPPQGAASVGRFTYCGVNVRVCDPRTTIGAFTSIAGNVTIGPSEHPMHYLSLSPYFYNQPGLRPVEEPREFINPVHIGHDVWIGEGVFIKQGVGIGHGAVVGAGSVVTKHVPPYAVVAGVPAKVLKYRFDEATMEALLALAWWDLPDEQIATLPFENMEACLQRLRQLRQPHEQP